MQCQQATLVRGAWTTSWTWRIGRILQFATADSANVLVHAYENLCIILSICAAFIEDPREHTLKRHSINLKCRIALKHQAARSGRHRPCCASTICAGWRRANVDTAPPPGSDITMMYPVPSRVHRCPWCSDAEYGTGSNRYVHTPVIREE